MAADTTATLADLLPSEAVTAEYLLMLADRNASLLAHPAIVYAGDAMGRGSATFKVSELGLGGYRRLSPVAQGSAVAPIPLDNDSATITVAPWRKAYRFADLVRAVEQGRLTPTVLARDAVMAVAMTAISMIAQLVGGFSNVSGTSGAQLTGLDLLEARGNLSSRSVPGPYVAVLSGQQVKDFHAWLAVTSGGGVQWMPATQEQLNAYGEGFLGIWGGIWLFQSNLVPTVGSDSAGGMFGRGAILFADSSFAPEPDPNIVDFGGAVDGRAKVRFERSRTGLAGNTDYITHAQLGAAEHQDEAGESLLTRASA